jgi:hypothetical protein
MSRGGSTFRRMVPVRKTMRMARRVVHMSCRGHTRRWSLYRRTVSHPRIRMDCAAWSVLSARRTMRVPVPLFRLPPIVVEPLVLGGVTVREALLIVRVRQRRGRVCAGLRRQWGPCAHGHERPARLRRGRPWDITIRVPWVLLPHRTWGRRWGALVVGVAVADEN